MAGGAVMDPYRKTPYPAMPRRAKPATEAVHANQAILETLLSKAATGDREAFLEIYDRMAPRVLGVIDRILGGGGAPSERVLEGVFAQLWTAARQLSGAKESVAAWLTFRARSAALRTLRTGDASPEPPGHRPVSEEPDSLPGWMPDAESISRIEQRRPLLVKVLGQLPNEQLKALELVVFEGRIESEVAERLHEPLARTRAELRAAARFLRHRRRAVVGSWGVNI
jgi:RNA polymerase sigma-70 factor, ECF subfamily